MCASTFGGVLLAQNYARSVPPEYVPPGLSTHGGFWWKFSDNSRTNIPDYGPSGTNKCWVVDPSVNATWNNGGWRLNNSTVSYVRSSDASIMVGATCITYAVWLKLDQQSSNNGWIIGETDETGQMGLRILANSGSIDFLSYDNQIHIEATNALSIGEWCRVVLAVSAPLPSYYQEYRIFTNGVLAQFTWKAFGVGNWVVVGHGKTTLGRVYQDPYITKGTFANAVGVRNYAWTTNDVAYDYQNASHP